MAGRMTNQSRRVKPVSLPEGSCCRSSRVGAATALIVCAALSARSNPQGMTVAHGTVSATQNGSQLNVLASQNAVIKWQSFNIAAGETTTFIQPSAQSVVWNRISDLNPSQIWGALNANGTVVLMNQNGFYFGPNASINVGGFIAASAAVLPPPAVGGGMWTYQGPPPTARIINYGEIRAQTGGSLFLIADGIENHGLLSAPDGTIGLYSGKNVLISDRPDGRGLSANVQLPEGSIDNDGQIIADAGSIALHAQVVNQNGLIQANSVRNQQGVIELVAGSAVNLGGQSLLQADGDSGGASDGGRITVRSAGTYVDAPDSRIEARGGASGGNGGAMEISALSMDEIRSQLDGGALAGWTSGHLLLDPYNIILANTGSSAPAGNVGDHNPPTSPGAALQINVNAAFKGFSQITLQAINNISLATSTTWDLNASTGVSSPGSELTLQAGNNILFNNGSSLQAGAGWSVNLSAGVDFSSPTLNARHGIGGIYLNGGPPTTQGSAPNLNGAIQAADGDITLNAGHEVLVGQGYIRTINGGNISITTGDGDVNAGTDAATYSYSRNGYAVSSLGLGGIGTANGGSVTINAGGNISSPIASIGAFGLNPGDVTLSANGSISGKFMIRNGTGTILAGVQVQDPSGPNPQVTEVLNPNADIGSASAGVSLGIAGGGATTPGWNVFAARNIFVNEVYNPNGSLNQVASVPFQFDYAPAAYARFFGGNSVQLAGTSIARTPSNPDRPPIYAPILDITAGAGGIVLGNDVVLYPSPLGSLNFSTSGGGSLRSTPGQFYQLIVSDSDSPDYTTFATGHAASPLHLGGAGDGVHLHIDGDIQNVFLSSPEAADIHVGGNAVNFSLDVQNLSANDATVLDIAGDYVSRSDRTFVTLDDTPDLAALTDPVLSMNPALGARLTYDPTTHQLGIQGIMSAADLAFLLHPTTYVLNPLTGGVTLDAHQNPVIVPATFTTDAAALQQLYTGTQDIPTSPLAHVGLQIGGPGQFDLSAHNLDLGISAGIRSVGPLNNPALAAVSLRGANLNLDLSGNLDMTSSQIASFNGGDIAVNCLGQMEIGSQQSFGSDSTPKGIYTGHGGSVTVHAAGDINVDGSRIASYDGGDVSVISDNGDVNAGGGSKGFFFVTTSQLNPLTGQVEVRNDEFFGSGIMAVTRSDGNATVGNIAVKAGRDIIAGASGILQLAFNQINHDTATLDLDAGRDVVANQTGVLGENVSVNAGRNVVGFYVAKQDLNLVGPTISGIGLGGRHVDVQGNNLPDLKVVGPTVDVSGAGEGGGPEVIATGSGGSGAGTAFANVAAPAAQQTTESADKTIAAQTAAQSNDDDEEKKRAAGGKSPALTRHVGRVTVILPKS